MNIIDSLFILQMPLMIRALHVKGLRSPKEIKRPGNSIFSRCSALRGQEIGMHIVDSLEVCEYEIGTPSRFSLMLYWRRKDDNYKPNSFVKDN